MTGKVRWPDELAAAARALESSRAFAGPVRSLVAEATASRRASVKWNVEDDGDPHVVDLTWCNRWPDVCSARLVMDLRGRPVRRSFVCTRRAGHGGRHAAGAFGRVVAVWAS